MKNRYDIVIDELNDIESLHREYGALFGGDREQLENYMALRAVCSMERVKRDLNEKLILAQKYGYDEYADQICRLMESMNELRKYMKGGA